MSLRLGKIAVRFPSEARGSTASGQRLRAGITGLAAIFLIVLIAAAGIRPARSVGPAGVGEPLAQLGVTPSSAHEASARSDAAAKPTRI